MSTEYLSIKEPLLSSKEYRKRWAELIKNVYEVDPLICPKCRGKMSIIAFTIEKLVIDKLPHTSVVASRTFPFPTTTGPTS